MSSVPSSSYSTPNSSPGEPYPIKSLRSEIDDDDRQSAHSDASNASRADQAMEALRHVAGSRVRHGSCAPEFLEDIAAKVTYTHLSRTLKSKFKVVAGAEAKSFFQHYIGKHTEDKHPRNHDDVFMNNDSSPSGTVFAVTVRDQHTRTRCVDYYMTWRSLRKSTQSKELEARISLLDSEFKKLTAGLDREYKRIKSLQRHHNLSGSSPKFDKLSLREGSPRLKAPPGITVSTPDEEQDRLDDPKHPPFPRPPLSATDSVMSLPNLTYLRNVPGSHQLKLRVTNPDRFSVLSTEVTPVEAKSDPARMWTSIESTVKRDVQQRSLSVPTVVRRHQSRDDENMDSSDTNTSVSSQSSQCGSPDQPPTQLHNSGDKDIHDSVKVECPQFLIVVLGDRLDVDPSSWHGLQHHASIRTVPSERHSPWIGPLAGPPITPPRLPSVYNPTGDNDDRSSDDEEQWYNQSAPVIPLKPMMESMGYLPKSYYGTPAVVPAGLPYRIPTSTVGSPGPNQSPYLYSSPRLDGSPYSPWMPPLPPMSVASSRPSSRTYKAASYTGSYTTSSHSGHY